MMMLAGPSTARDLLFQAAGPDPSEELALGLDPHLGEAAARRPRRCGPGVDLARRGRRGGGPDGLDLGDVLAAGWQRHSALRAAGRRTKEEPGIQETVVLAEHRISYEAHPYVDVLLAEAHLTRVTVTLLLTADVTGLAASVSEGRLTGLSAGRALLTAALELAGAPVVRRTVDLRLPLDVGLGEGLRLA